MGGVRACGSRAVSLCDIPQCHYLPLPRLSQRERTALAVSVLVTPKRMPSSRKFCTKRCSQVSGCWRRVGKWHVDQCSWSTLAEEWAGWVGKGRNLGMGQYQAKSPEAMLGSALQGNLTQGSPCLSHCTGTRQPSLHSLSHGPRVHPRGPLYSVRHVLGPAADWCTLQF